MSGPASSIKQPRSLSIFDVHMMEQSFIALPEEVGVYIYGRVHDLNPILDGQALRIWYQPLSTRKQ